MQFKVYSWQPIETVPDEEKLWLQVVGAAGEQYSLPFACTKRGPDYITEKGSKLQVTPVGWRSYFPRTVSMNPRYAKQSEVRTDGVSRTRYANIREDS